MRKKQKERIFFRYRDEKDFQVASGLIVMKASLAIFGFTLFITGLIGILFFISSGVMLYFKVYSSMEEAKVKYAMLYKTGIIEKEIRSSIAHEIKPIFFLIPSILGGMLGVGFIAILYVNTVMYHKILMNTAYLMLIYTFPQGLLHHYKTTIYKHHISTFENVKDTYSKRKL